MFHHEVQFWKRKVWAVHKLAAEDASSDVQTPAGILKDPQKRRRLGMSNSGGGERRREINRREAGPRRS